MIGSSRRGGVIHLLFSSWDREPSPVPLSRGAYWGVLPEHKEPSPVFLCSMVLTCSSRLGGGFNLVFHRGTRNRPLSHILFEHKEPSPVFTMCVHGAGKFDPRALAVGLIEVFILGQGTVPCPIHVFTSHSDLSHTPNKLAVIFNPTARTSKSSPCALANLYTSKGYPVFRTGAADA